MSKEPPFETQAQYEAQRVDQTILLSDLSHQIEVLNEALAEARAEVDRQHLASIKAEARADAYKDLLHQLLRQ